MNMRIGILSLIVALCTVATVQAKEWPGLRKERIGKVRIGDSSDVAVKQFGQPSQRPPVEEEKATGEWTSTWPFANGIVVLMWGNKTGPLAVRSITVSAPNKLKTVDGIGIGSSLATLKKAYGKYLTKPTEGTNDWTVGSGLSFQVEKGVVVSYYLGPLGGE